MEAYMKRYLFFSGIFILTLGISLAPILVFILNYSTFKKLPLYDSMYESVLLFSLILALYLAVQAVFIFLGVMLYSKGEEWYNLKFSRKESSPVPLDNFSESSGDKEEAPGLDGLIESMNSSLVRLKSVSELLRCQTRELDRMNLALRSQTEELTPDTPKTELQCRGGTGKIQIYREEAAFFRLYRMTFTGELPPPDRPEDPGDGGP
jgi:hypothetical protein